MNRARLAGIGVGLALLLGAASAPAIAVYYDFRLVSSSPVPGNGVLVFEVSGNGGLEVVTPSVVVQGPSGPVAGEFTMDSRFLVWHPDAELPVGDYTVEVTCLNREFCHATGPVAFQVTEPRVLEPPSATCGLTLVPITTYGEQELCCGLLPERTAGMPYCFPTSLRSNQVGLRAMTCHVDLAGAEAEQIFLTVVETPREDPAPSYPPSVLLSPPLFRQFTPIPVDATGIMEVQTDPPRRLAEAPEYCVELELMDTRTGVTTLTRGCEPNPGWEPVEEPIEDPEASLLGLPDCEVPPAGLEERWCELNRAFYDGICVSGEYTSESTIGDCDAYEQTCGIPPTPDPTADPAPANADPAPGCACRLAAPLGRDDAGSRTGLLALLALIGLRGARRARRTRASSVSTTSGGASPSRSRQSTRRS